jgi:hypothetical protein
MYHAVAIISYLRSSILLSVGWLKFPGIRYSKISIRARSIAHTYFTSLHNFIFLQTSFAPPQRNKVCFMSSNAPPYDVHELFVITCRFAKGA